MMTNDVKHFIQPLSTGFKGAVMEGNIFTEKKKNQFVSTASEIFETLLKHSAQVEWFIT